MTGSPLPASAEVPLSTRQSVLYGVGHFGLSVLGYVIVACVVPFYESGQAAGPDLAAAGRLIALVLFVTRLIDLIADPLAGFISDRTFTRWGRRKPYMLLSAPLVVLSFILVWHPPAGEALAARAWYAAILLTIFFVCFAAYAAPYLGLLPEIARTPGQRARLATTQGVFHLLGTTTAALATGVLGPVFGVARTSLVLGLLCLAAMWLALLGPHETEAAQRPPRQIGLRTAMRQTLTNWPFLIYWAGYYLFWVPLLVVVAGVGQAAQGWFGLGPGGAGSILAVPLLGGLLFLPLSRRVMARRGPRWTFLAGLLWLAMTGPLLALMGALHAHGPWAVWEARLLALLLSPAVAVLFSVPYTVLAEICDQDYRRLNSHREAMYFGFQGLMMKAGWGVAPLLVALLSGAFPGAVGLRMFGPLAGALALLGFVVFWFYPERRVLEEDGGGASSGAQEVTK